MSELRANGRDFTGVAIRYGDAARVYDPVRRVILDETIEAGAFSPIEHVTLEVMHQRDLPVVMTPEMRVNDSDTQLSIAARIPNSREGDIFIEGINSGELRALSIDMDVLEDDVTDGQRLVKRARLNRIAAVPEGAYQTTAELRQSIGTLSAPIPWNTALYCDCSNHDGDMIEIEPGAFAASLASGKTFIAGLESGGLGGLGSTRRNSLRMRETPTAMLVDIDIPPTTAGRDIAALAADVGLLVRPMFDSDASTFTVTGGVATYTDMQLSFILVKAAGNDTGWPLAKFRRGGRTTRRGLRGKVFV